MNQAVCAHQREWSNDVAKGVECSDDNVIHMCCRDSSAERQQCQSIMTEDADLELLQDHEQSIRKLEVCGISMSSVLRLLVPRRWHNSVQHLRRSSCLKPEGPV